MARPCVGGEPWLSPSEVLIRRQDGSRRAAAIFRQRGIDVDEKPGLSAEELNAVIGGYDGVAVRSSTRINAAAMDAALPRLKVIGRAGIGVDTSTCPPPRRAASS